MSLQRQERVEHRSRVRGEPLPVANIEQLVDALEPIVDDDRRDRRRIQLRMQVLQQQRIDLPDDLGAWRDEPLVERWKRLIDMRVIVNGALEAQRQAKTIGTALEAKVVLTATGPTLALLRESAPHLPMLFIVSETVVREGADGGAELAVEVVRSDGTKCVRCWRYVHDISTEPAFAGLCGRCVEAVAELV